MLFDKYFLYGSYIGMKRLKHRTEELWCVLMGSEEFQRENKQPRKMTSSSYSNR
jgi:hypothetical protein